MKRNKAAVAIGIDLGGTKICGGAISTEGKILAGKIFRLPTGVEKGKECILSNLYAVISACLEECKNKEILGIGIGSPGPLDIEKGVLLNPPNLKPLHNFNLRSAVYKKFNLPVEINNDANVFVLGEACYGAGKKYNLVYGVTLGTGFGSGFVMNKSIYSGATGTAAEIWCFPYEDGIIEDYVSARGITSLYRKRTKLTLPPEEIARLAFEGDNNAISVWEEFGHYLGVALTYVVDVIDPEVIIIGGSISKSYKLFERSLKETLYSKINPLPAKKLKIFPSRLKDEAGIIGAACLILKKNINSSK